MNEPAAIAAQLVDIRNVGTHKVVKLTIHAPEEHAMKIMEAFGWPTMVAPVPVALARLVDPTPKRNGKKIIAGHCVQEAYGGARCVGKCNDPRDCSATPAEAVTTPPRPSGNVSASVGGAEKERRKFTELKPAQQAGILSNQESFKVFLGERFGQIFVRCRGDAAACIREICEVNSRSDLTEQNDHWSALLLAFRLWEREPEFVPS